MKVSQINTFTYNRKFNHINTKRDENKQVAFGFSEDYGPDYCMLSDVEGEGNDATPWQAFKDSLTLMFVPITLPVITYKIHLKDKKEDALFRDMMNFKDKDSEVIQPKKVRRT